MTASTVPLLDVSPSPERSLVGRVRSILLRPGTEWPIIAVEETNTASLYIRYIAPLAAIPPVASVIGMSLFGVRLPFGGTYRASFSAAISSAVVHYAVALAAVYVLALIIDAAAPTFGGERNRLQALKVAAYASTASWIAGGVALVPVLGVLGILGLYSLYLVYLGLPVLMRSPRERALGYATVVIVSAIALFMVAGAIGSRFIAYPSISLPVR